MNKQEYINILSRLDKLEKYIFKDGDASSATTDAVTALRSVPEINYSLNHKAYVSRYAVNKSGPKKFVLILAFLTKGEVGKEISISEIKDLWKRMGSKKLLGNYNNFYSNESRTRGWVDSSKYGFCHLTDEWENIFK